jgi:hypothetical protein
MCTYTGIIESTAQESLQEAQGQDEPPPSPPRVPVVIVMDALHDAFERQMDKAAANEGVFEENYCEDSSVEEDGENGMDDYHFQEVIYLNQDDIDEDNEGWEAQEMS